MELEGARDRARLGPPSHHANTRKEPPLKTTTFDGTHIHYTCPYCSQKKEERADPRLNPNPFQFLQYRCTGCGRSMDLDWDVIEDAQAALRK